MKNEKNSKYLKKMPKIPKNQWGLDCLEERIGARERVSGNTSLAVCTIRLYYRLRISFAGRDATYHPLQRTRKISSKERLVFQAENSSISISVFYLGFPWM